MPFFQSNNTAKVRGVCDGRDGRGVPVTRIGFMMILHCNRHILKTMMGRPISLFCRTRAVLSETPKGLTEAPFLYQLCHQLQPQQTTIARSIQ